MKAELVHVPNKGLCILISDITTDLINGTTSGNLSNLRIVKPLFPYPEKVAIEISGQRKIAAIKETRSQTGWGLKEAKEYIDRYMPVGYRDPDTLDFHAQADKFMADHTIREETFNAEEFKL